MSSSPDRSNKRGITITFGEVAENHIRMQKIGVLAEEGLTNENLRLIASILEKNGIAYTLVDLGEYLPSEYGKIEALLLIVPNGIEMFNVTAEKAYSELSPLDYDSKALMYGRVVNKKARHNLCFSDVDQDPDYISGKGRIISFSSLPILNHLRTYLPKLAGVEDEERTEDSKTFSEILKHKLTNLQAEANLYYNVDECGIGFHSDLERKVVIGLRLGSTFPLVYQWFFKSQPIGPRIDFSLDSGTMYFMSEKASGNDGRKRTIPILRHAAGAEKYLKIKTPKSKS